VEYHLEAVGVGGRNLFEHVAADIRATILQGEFGRPQLTWIIEGFRQVQHRPGEMRLRLEEGANQMTVPTADIGNRANTRKVVILERFKNQLALSNGMARH